MSSKILKIIFVILILVTIGEAGYYLFVIKKQSQKNTLNDSSVSSTPTLALAITNDQSYRNTDAPDRLTRFLNTALMSVLTELSNFSPTKSVNFKMNTQYEGKIDAIHQGKDAEAKFPPDSKFPERTVVLIIDIIDTSQPVNTKPTKSILLVASEMSNLKISDEHGKTLNLDEITGKQVRINRIIELPVTKTVDIVTLEPIVSTNIVVSEK